MTKTYLDEVYAIRGDRDIKKFYDDWSESYESELKNQDYATPARCAAALRRCDVSLDARLLDVGCGTGLSGDAFVYSGYTDLHGTDLSPEMLAVAEAKQIYGKLWTTVPEAPTPALPGDYDVIAAVGVISPGAGPADLLTDLADLLVTGGRLVFSYNDHALADENYMHALAQLGPARGMRKEFEEYGAHLPNRDLGATVYVYQKT